MIKCVVLALLFMPLASGVSSAVDAYPNHPIEMTVLFPPGSSADVTARLLADGMSRQLGVNVIVLNKPGAGGAIGYRYVAQQKPDGYSLVWNSNSISTNSHSGTLPLTYEAFDAVAQVLVESPVLAVRTNTSWKTLADLMAAAKAKPKTITVANSGVGSHTHISSVALFHAAEAQVVDVPFSGAQVVTSLLGGQVDAAMQLPAALTEYVKSGQLSLLTSLTDERDPAFPIVPTARELGYPVSLEAWRGIAVPKGTPALMIAALDAAIRKTVASPEFVMGCERLGARPAYKTGSAFGQLIAKDDGELANLMSLIGLKK